MSFRVIDRTAIFDDEHKQRIKRIALIQCETGEMAPIWSAKQASLYPTVLQISQTQSLGQVITDEIQKRQRTPTFCFNAQN